MNIGGLLNIGNMVSGIAQKAFPGSGGKLIGGITGGLANFATGNVFGAVGNALQAFQGLAGGVSNLAGGGRMPSPMGMGGMGSMMPFGQTGGALGNAAAGGPGGFTAQMKGVMNNKNMSPEQKKMAMLDLQEKKDMFDQMIQTLTSMQKRSHDTNMAIIRNLS